jgi:hypothetical protein
VPSLITTVRAGCGRFGLVLISRVKLEARRSRVGRSTRGDFPRCLHQELSALGDALLFSHPSGKSVYTALYCLGELRLPFDHELVVKT